MEKLHQSIFFRRLFRKKAYFPFVGHIELTYRCNLDCIHCYCKGAKRPGAKELTTEEWKKILDVLQKEGCPNLCLTGGEPLIRDDFLEIYAYAKTKGFFVTLFTNGQTFTTKIIDYLVKSPPLSIEITLSGITKRTYESITQIPGSFIGVMRALKLLKEKKLPLVLKANCLKQNKEELGRIKAFAEELLGKPPKGKYRFKYDAIIFPRLNRDRTPCNNRLSFEEMQEVRKQDPEIWKQYRDGLKCKIPTLDGNKNFLYLCDAWQKQFFIDPYGYLKFCEFSDKFSVNLKTTSFREGFYNIFPKLLSEKFKTNSECRDCAIRPICYNCPARAYLETGNEEAPSPYYCQLAKTTARMKTKLRNR